MTNVLNSYFLQRFARAEFTNSLLQITYREKEKDGAVCLGNGEGRQQHTVQLAGNKSRGSLTSSEPFIYIERRRSKEQNKCQTCRCANKSKLEQEKKIMLYPFNLCFTLANGMTQPRFLAELHAVSLNGATRKCRGHLQSLLWLCRCLAGWHRLQELQSCSQLLKDGERKRIQTLSQKLILLPVMSTISYFSHKKSFQQSTVLASGFSKKH